MNQTIIAKATLTVNASTAKVWSALVRPQFINRFDTEATTDLRVGSRITYKGTREGKTYEDKGEVLQVETGRLLISTLWSSMTDLPDVPENYKTVRYDLSAEGEGTRLTITFSDHNNPLAEASHSAQNLKAVPAE